MRIESRNWSTSCKCETLAKLGENAHEFVSNCFIDRSSFIFLQICSLISSREVRRKLGSNDWSLDNLMLALQFDAFEKNAENFWHFFSNFSTFFRLCSTISDFFSTFFVFFLLFSIFFDFFSIFSFGRLSIEKSRKFVFLEKFELNAPHELNHLSSNRPLSNFKTANIHFRLTTFANKISSSQISKWLEGEKKNRQ